MYILPHLFVTISLLLLPLVYHNFTPTLSQPVSTLILLALIYDIFTPRFSEHASGFVEEIEEFQNVFLLDETSSFDVLECLKVQACQPVSKEILNYLDDVNKYDKTNVTLCVKSHDDFVENNFINGGGYGSNLGKNGCTREEEEWKSTLAWKLFEERHYNVVQGEEGMDSLWEAFEADSIKSGRIDVVVKTKDMKKKSGELDKMCVNEDGDGEEGEMRNGFLQGFRCCSASTGGKMMNMRRGRSSIVKITKTFKMITWWRHLKMHAKTNMILI